MEIKVGEYVRTKNGTIRKIAETLNNIVIADKPYYESYCETEAISKRDIVKHSNNIIDLIKIGDILRVFDNLSETEEKVNVFDDEMLKAVKKDIKDNNYEILSILTHEQFSSLEYKI